MLADCSQLVLHLLIMVQSIRGMQHHDLFFCLTHAWPCALFDKHHGMWLHVMAHHFRFLAFEQAAPVIDAKDCLLTLE